MEIKWAATCRSPRTWWGPILSVILGPFVIMRTTACKVKSMCQWLQLRVLSCLSKRRRNSNTRCFLGWNRRWARLWHLPNLHYMPLRNSSGFDENLKKKNPTLWNKTTAYYLLLEELLACSCLGRHILHKISKEISCQQKTQRCNFMQSVSSWLGNSFGGISGSNHQVLNASFSIL